MAISQTLLKIDDTEVTNLVDYEVEYNKLWKDADRNMNGEVRAAFIGIFPKIKCKTTVQDQAKVATLGALINQPYFDVDFYNPLTDAVVTGKSYYASDYSVKLMERSRELFYEISFNLIPVAKQ